MDLEFTPEQAELRCSLRRYFAALMGGGRKHLGRGEHRTEADKAVLRRMGADGWLGVGFPAEYGGLGFGPVEQFIFLEEARRAGAPLSSVTIMTIGPSIVRFGTDEQKERFVPGILRGEITFAVGYSEPDAGTDLGRLRTRAVRDGGEYVITGQKYWTSGGDSADYIWLAARTDPESTGYEGVSLFIVPTTSPGFRCSVVETLASHRTTATYYEEVRVPASAMVGRENRGWDVVTSQLNLERLMMIMPGPVEELFWDLVAWCRAPQDHGRRPIDEAWVQMELARVQAGLRALRLLVWRAVSDAARTRVNPGDVSAVKVLGSELYVDACRRMLDVAGEAGAVVEGSPGSVLAGRLEESYRTAAIKTFGGGVNEVQREIVGRHRLGLPRVPRPSDRGR
jgi:alkylation response protein AidB-like acyl-CoA dehydrogenase